MTAIQSGLANEFIRAGAVLYTSAFAEKLIPFLGNQEQTADLIESSIVPQNCLAAVKDRSLEGILAIQTCQQCFIQPQMKNLQSHFGFIGGSFRALGLSLIRYQPQPDELYIEALAVAESARGKGVGTRLLDEVIVLAKEQGFKKITLHVIDANPRARQLYERLGFVIKKSQNIWPINRILGWNFNKVIFMALEI